MAARVLESLSMAKYERLLPRIFPGASRVDIRDMQNRPVWCMPATSADEPSPGKNGNADGAWAEFVAGIDRRQSADGALEFRSALLARDTGAVGWLTVSYKTEASIPMASAPDAVRRSFGEATAFMSEEIELQSECNQLAVELTERYEELNLVYSTKDQVEYFEEGQEALVRLVYNCGDYLDVGLAALICRDRNLILHNVSTNADSKNIDAVMELLGTSIYDHVEAQVRCIVLNENENAERARIFGNRSENLLAHPVIDDHGTAIGLLAVVARKDRHTFSNGDRNLLEVMAKKASRIIHTHHDSLTGLMNRSGFESSLVGMLGQTRNNNVQHCLLHIGIDQLHVVNDLLGYEVGDNLIRRVAKAMRSIVRDSDLLARLGGDEFGVLLTSCGVQRGEVVADKLRNAVHELTVVSARRQLDVSASIGIAMMSPDTESIIGIMASAEIACKAAKEAGRDRVQIFAQDNTTLVRRSEEIEWIGRVQQALRDDHFQLYCQPVVPLDDTRSPHFEILVRMLDDSGDILAPGLFMPAAERYQLMPMIDRWVIRNTLQALGNCWASASAANPVFCINLSGQSLTNPGFLTFVIDELGQYEVPAQNICFEITETAAISNVDEALAFMGSLRARGCLFALDDFGAGLSSFGYLKVLPVDYLKIDGSFVREVTTDEISLSMVSAICQIGSTMGLSLVAEYVNDDETTELLRSIGVDYVQGFGVGKPVPLRDVTDGLQDQAKPVSA